ncbi:LysE family translocator [Rhodobacteraceae bacterium 2CG4]|uniref:LysE family translocator n=1 Tax=Halovulum marinum TaxID=2662447 RepID=A0A6L5Z3C6_9RHOB|nr:LysE family translocator [Halovulum marinum]MSU90484.1 LysE family translocator [Halovulum marinum]
MTLTPAQIGLYAGALFILFLTPGPVWVALIARALAAGFHGAWPLALGVVVGDVLWPLLAVFGVGFIVSVYGDALAALRIAGAVIFVVMGLGLIRGRHRTIGENSALTAPGIWAGFTAGVLVILGNPKAILFYMGVLPGFFDLSAITGWDIAAICLISALVPLAGNLLLAVFLGRVRAILSSPAARARLNLGAGVTLILVGFAIALT